MRTSFYALCIFLLSAFSHAEERSVVTVISHGYLPFGELKYPEDFKHFDYVNPSAPKGGELKLYAAGTFNSVNPYILKGKSLADTSAYIFGYLEFSDSLLTGASPYHHTGDEAQSGYGLIAESIEYPADRTWCIFTIRPQARFNDGKKITAEDVVFSFNTLKNDGHPRYAIALQNVESATALSKNRVKFEFSGNNRRALPLTVGHLPIIPKHYWSKHDISKADFAPAVMSNAYSISEVLPGRQITLQRNPNYWGKDLPVNKGRYNFDTIVIDFYRDAQVAFEAFKTNGYDIHLDYIAKHWATAYDFPAINSGLVKREAVKHSEPQGTQAFFLNLRKPQFQDVRVREALGLLFDFEWTNKSIFNGAYKRQTTWFPNSDNAASSIPTGKELTLLQQYKKLLPNELFNTAFQLPMTDGSGHNRQQLRQALALFKQAGWEIKQQKLVNISTGEQLTLDIIINHNPGMERVIQPWLRNLEMIGIKTNYRSIDSSSYKERMDQFDYDVTVLVLSQQAFPGPELKEYFHSEYANTIGGNNFSGISNPVVDGLIDATLSADNIDDYRAAIHALDRVLLWNHYIIPHWYLGHHRIAWWNKFGRPDKPSPYNLGTDTWWSKPLEE